MKEKIKITPEQIKIFDSGNKIETADGIYMNFPYWIKKNGEKDTYDLFTRSEIPGLESNYKRGGLEKSKYEIKKTDGSPMDPSAWYFVLRVDKDPHAKVATMAYAKSVAKDNIRLAIELISVILSYDPEQKHNSAYWQTIYPYKILDPDGWDRTDFNYSWFEEEITWKEFNNRAVKSNCILIRE